MDTEQHRQLDEDGCVLLKHVIDQAQVDRLLAGASPEDIAVAEASVAQAQAGLDQAQAAAWERFRAAFGAFLSRGRATA